MYEYIYVPKWERRRSHLKVEKAHTTRIEFGANL